jgi:1,4-alpha-glucan branching enzyme
MPDLTEKTGLFNFVLNAHLPYVRHPLNSKDFMEERWLFQSIIESYLPLLRVFKQLDEDKIPFRCTIAFSPTLICMLNDADLQEKCLRYIVDCLILAEKELERTKDNRLEHQTALLYHENLSQALNQFEQYQGDILKEFITLRDSGHCEFIASAATFAFLPLYQQHQNAVRAQIGLAVRQFMHTFNERPKGFWLPHCGYYPGVEKLLEEAGIKYFYTATHAILHADEAPRYGIYAPAEVRDSSVAAFARDRSSVNEIWDKEKGYSNNPQYRDFYHDIGFSLPLEYLGRHALFSGERIATGFKYKARGDGNHEEDRAVYNIGAALNLVKEHAKRFVDNRLQKFRTAKELMGHNVPIITSAFDMEFLGHWWFEGPRFINEVFRNFSRHTEIKSMTGGDYLNRFCNLQSITPAFSSWGAKDSYSQPWLDENNSWLLPHIFKLIERMSDLANRFADSSGINKRILNQAARETLLVMASDWPLMIKAQINEEFALNQLKKHFINFYKIYDSMSNNHIESEWLIALEREDNLFYDLIDYNFFSDHFGRP